MISEIPMMTTTYANAKRHLDELLEQVTSNQEVIIIKRHGRDDVALISAADLSGLFACVHLLRSPANAIRLLGCASW